MGLFGWFAKAWKKLVNLGKKLLECIIKGVLNFFLHIASWFRQFGLIQGRHIPFIAKNEAIADMADLADRLDKAPRKDAGIFKGVYDEQTEEIIHHEVIYADQVDQETKDTLGNDDLVVLY